MRIGAATGAQQACQDDMQKYSNAILFISLHIAHVHSIIACYMHERSQKRDI